MQRYQLQLYAAPRLGFPSGTSLRSLSCCLCSRSCMPHISNDHDSGYVNGHHCFTWIYIFSHFRQLRSLTGPSRIVLVWVVDSHVVLRGNNRFFVCLLLYANVVGVNRATFLPVESTNLFSLLIAWLNFIETCFYNGMDTYSKTWLQFVFPVYIWVLVGLMILVSHFSQKFARLLGNNPVSILATLILLSYTKILRTLIAVLYVTFLEYSKHNRSVWLYDANINFLTGKHIPLFLVAVLVFLFLPYTLLLLFGQWLQTISHLRLGCQVGERQHCYTHRSSHLLRQAFHNYVACVFS